VRRASRHGTNTLTAKVTDRLRRAILDAEFALGEALSEDSLATALGVSRTPVREALSALQLQGLIVIEPQRGSYVFSPSEQDVDELCAFRRILEIEAMRLCFVHQREATVAQLQWASTEMEAAKRASDHLKVARADGAFHEALLENSGNQYLVEAYKLVSGRVAALRARNLTGARSVRSKAMAEHRAIIEAATSRGDPHCAHPQDAGRVPSGQAARNTLRACSCPPSHCAGYRTD